MTMDYESINEEEVKYVLESPKTAYDDINWKRKNDSVFIMEQEILITEDTFILLKGSINTKFENYGYDIIYRNQRICALDYKEHKNPDGSIVGKPHLHKWQRSFNTGYATCIEDPELKNCKKAFMWFIEYCKIYLAGRIFWPLGKQLEVSTYGLHFVRQINKR